MKKLTTLLSVLVILLWTVGMASALPVSVDLSGATSGSFIDGNGADFAQAFVGQTVVGTGITGSPDNPLALNAGGGSLTVASWSAAGYSGNSILPQPYNQAPLSILLESEADSISWIMGYGNPPSSVTIDFFGNDGSLVASTSQSILDGYNSYSYGGFGIFSGLTIYNNNDPAGLRFMNFEYNTVEGNTPVPEPATMLLLGTGLLSIAGLNRKKFMKK